MAKAKETTAEEPQAPAEVSPEVQAELAALRAEVEKLAQIHDQALAPNSELESQVADLQLRLAALGARMSPADLMLQRATRSLERLEEQRRQGGRYRWRGENHYYKPAKDRPTTAIWYFYSDAKTPQDAEADFRRKTGVQHDTSDRRGNPFRFVPEDPELEMVAPQSPPRSLNKG